MEGKGEGGMASDVGMACVDGLCGIMSCGGVRKKKRHRMKAGTGGGEDGRGLRWQAPRVYRRKWGWRWWEE